MKKAFPIEVSILIYNYSHNIYFLCLYNQVNKEFIDNTIDYYFLNELNDHTHRLNDYKSFLIKKVKLFCENIIRNLVYFNKINLFKNTTVEFLNFELYKRIKHVKYVSEYLLLNEKYGISTYVYEIINSYIFYYSILYNKSINKPLLVDKLVLQYFYNEYQYIPKLVYCIPCNYSIIENLEYQYHLNSPYTLYNNTILSIENFDVPFLPDNNLILSSEIINHTYNLIDVEKIIVNNNSTLYFRSKYKVNNTINILYENYISDLIIYISFLFDKVLINNNLKKYFENNIY